MIIKEDYSDSGLEKDQTRRFLFFGDIIGSPGRNKVCTYLPELLEKENIFFVAVQGENIAGGIGITEDTAKQLFKAGVDCITTGNHVWKHKEFYDYLGQENRILRPANYPDGVPGTGFGVYEKQGTKIGLINLEGRVFMQPKEDPFKIGREIVEKMQKETCNIFVDFHAEATSEKKTLGYYLSKSVTACLGTHTHVQTADEQIINGHTAYITDIGMVGSSDSVIGFKRDEITKYILLSTPQKFKVAKDDIIANCVIVDFDVRYGQAKSIIRYNF
ncbi:MAG: TIGR00282 family metallophosphoesterase [bacterium]